MSDLTAEQRAASRAWDSWRSQNRRELNDGLVGNGDLFYAGFAAGLAARPVAADERERLKAAANEFRRQFGGGMVPFDTAYSDGRTEGLTVAEAQMAGAAELIDSFIAFAASRPPVAAEPDEARRVLGRIQARASHHKSEAGIQIRDTLRLICDEATSVLDARSEGEGTAG